MVDYTGQWWLETQEPLNLDPIPAQISDENVEGGEEDIDVDDGTPFPPVTGEDRPRCIGCGDPNFSLESEYCIACRIGMP